MWLRLLCCVDNTHIVAPHQGILGIDTKLQVVGDLTKSWVEGGGGGGVEAERGEG